MKTENLQKEDTKNITTNSDNQYISDIEEKFQVQNFLSELQPTKEKTLNLN